MNNEAILFWKYKELVAFASRLLKYDSKNTNVSINANKYMWSYYTNKKKMVSFSILDKALIYVTM